MNVITSRVIAPFRLARVYCSLTSCLFVDFLFVSDAFLRIIDRTSPWYENIFEQSLLRRGENHDVSIELMDAIEIDDL